MKKRCSRKNVTIFLPHQLVVTSSQNYKYKLHENYIHKRNRKIQMKNSLCRCCEYLKNLAICAQNKKQRLSL